MIDFDTKLRCWLHLVIVFFDVSYCFRLCRYCDFFVQSFSLFQIMAYYSALPSHSLFSSSSTSPLYLTGRWLEYKTLPGRWLVLVPVFVQLIDTVFYIPSSSMVMYLANFDHSEWSYFWGWKFLYNIVCSFSATMVVIGGRSMYKYFSACNGFSTLQIILL